MRWLFVLVLVIIPLLFFLMDDNDFNADVISWVDTGWTIFQQTGSYNDNWLTGMQWTWVYDYFLSIKNSENYQSFNPNPQPNLPLESDLDYVDRSSLLNNYLSKNTFLYKISRPIDKWYLYIKFYKTPTEPIFIYWYNTKNSWRLILSDALYVISSTEYLFDLSSIPILEYPNYEKYQRYNMIENEIRYSNRSNYIGMYIAWFNGNYIEEITIAYDFIP